MRNLVRLLVAGFAVVSLAACGSSDSPPPENLAEITSTNAETIAGAVIQATYEGGALGSFADITGGAGGSSATKAAAVFEKVGEVQIQTTKPMLTDSQIGTFRAPITPTETPCEVSGSTILSGDIANPETLSAGDILRIEFVDCNDGVTVVDGMMSMTIRSFAGDFVGGAVTFEIRVDLDALTVTQGDRTQTADGDITIGMSFPSVGPITMTITTNSLSISDGESTESLRDFELVQVLDVELGSYSLTVSGRITSSAFDGAVRFTTTVNLQGTGDADASSGRLVITGDNGATITVVVIDSQLVLLEVDLDGDGTPDQVINTSWAALTGESPA